MKLMLTLPIWKAMSLHCHQQYGKRCFSLSLQIEVSAYLKSMNWYRDALIFILLDAEN
jgi:hypothetical protein